MLFEKVNLNDKELPTSEIFGLKVAHIIFSDKLLVVKNDKTGKEFTISEEGFAILRNNKKNSFTVLNRNHG